MMPPSFIIGQELYFDKRMNPYSKCLRESKALLHYSAAEFFRNSQQLNQAMRMDRNGAAWSTMGRLGRTDR